MNTCTFILSHDGQLLDHYHTLKIVVTYVGSVTSNVFHEGIHKNT